MPDHPADYASGPAFEDCPTGGQIAFWFVENMRGIQNVGGDAWWLSRDPHGSCRMLAFIDYDVQEFYLLEIATEDSVDLLWVMCGYDGDGWEWWQNPKPSLEAHVDWRMDGIVWMTKRIQVHYDYAHNGRNGEADA